MSYLVIPMPSNQTGMRRSVYIVGHRGCVQATEFDAQPDKLRRPLLAVVDHWSARHGQPDQPKKYHGFDLSQYGGKFTNCFVFKRDSNSRMHRLYGYIVNPCTNRRVQVFVAVLLTTKAQHETDIANLNRVMAVHDDPEVAAALRKFGSNG